MKHFTTAVEAAQTQARRVYADKGFDSEANRDWLRSKRIKSAIMHRAAKNRALTERQRLANRLISQKRYIVDQCFGTGKRLFGMGRASYMTTIKVGAQMILKSICMNLTKAANKISMLIQSLRKKLVNIFQATLSRTASENMELCRGFLIIRESVCKN